MILAKSLLLILGIFILSCNNEKEVTPVETRDKILGKYIGLADSFAYFDTLNESFRLLKAYYRNDTNTLSKATAHLKELISATPFVDEAPCIQPKSLQSYNARQAYRFRYFQSFCPYRNYITLVLDDSVATLHYILYSRDESDVSKFDEGCKIQVQLEKLLSSAERKRVEDLLQHCDFWGMLYLNPHISGLDGSSLYIDGYMKDSYRGQEETHRIYRWRPLQSCVGELFLELLKISGIKKGCVYSP